MCRGTCDPGLAESPESVGHSRLNISDRDGFALNAPAFSAVVPEIVSNEDLPSASTLSGLQLNISAIAGPALGGLLLLVVGANTVFCAQRPLFSCSARKYCAEES